MPLNDVRSLKIQSLQKKDRLLHPWWPVPVSLWCSKGSNHCFTKGIQYSCLLYTNLCFSEERAVWEKKQKQKTDMKYLYACETDSVHNNSSEWCLLSAWIEHVFTSRLYIHISDIRVHAALLQLVTLPKTACIHCVHSGAGVYVIRASLCQGEQLRPGSGAVPAVRTSDEG